MDTRERGEVRELSASEMETVSGGTCAWLGPVGLALSLTKIAADQSGQAPGLDDAKAYLKGKGKP
jgi:hypothetical protein